MCFKRVLFLGFFVVCVCVFFLYRCFILEIKFEKPRYENNEQFFLDFISVFGKFSQETHQRKYRNKKNHKVSAREKLVSKILVRNNRTEEVTLILVVKTIV